jgi:hypothetical protein
MVSLCLISGVLLANSVPVISSHSGEPVTFRIKENSERTFFNGWDKTLGGASAENIRSVIKTRDGGFLFLTNSQSGISGNKTDAKIGTKDFWVIKTLQSGQIEWAQTYGGKWCGICKHCDRITSFWFPSCRVFKLRHFW